MLRIGNAGRNSKPAFLRRRPGFPSWSWADWDGQIRTADSEALSTFLDESCNPIEFEDNRFATRFWIETTDGLQMSLAEYHNAITPSHMTIEVSPILRVEARIVKLRFQRHSQKYFSSSNTLAYWCMCHPTSTHDNEIPTLQEEDPSFKYSNVRLHENPTMDNCVDERLFDQLWDGIILGKVSYTSF